MGTITIKSNKKDDLYFISELARRLGMAAKIETDEITNTRGQAIDKTSNDVLVQMGTTSSGSALADFLKNETETMF